MGSIENMTFYDQNQYEVLDYYEAYPTACDGMSCGACPLGRRRDELSQGRFAGYFLCDYPDRDPGTVLTFLASKGIVPVQSESDGDLLDANPNDLASIL